ELDAAPIDVALAAAAAERRRHDQVLEHGHAVERLRNLKRAADAQAAAPFRRQMGDVDAREDDAPGIGRNRAAGDAEQRGLAGRVAARDRGGLARRGGGGGAPARPPGGEGVGSFLEGGGGGDGCSTTGRGLWAPPPPVGGGGWGGGWQARILLLAPSLSLPRK